MLPLFLAYQAAAHRPKTNLKRIHTTKSEVGRLVLVATFHCFPPSPWLRVAKRLFLSFFFFSLTLVHDFSLRKPVGEAPRQNVYCLSQALQDEFQ